MFVSALSVGDDVGTAETVGPDLDSDTTGGQAFASCDNTGGGCKGK
jgi:hypothetical protein